WKQMAQRSHYLGREAPLRRLSSTHLFFRLPGMRTDDAGTVKAYEKENNRGHRFSREDRKRPIKAF
ncbi:MAG: hypothetical protein OK454_01375, partial [Thaumarchaeota archaeon]|nr:hypothetical protein [Nitrososphaerota archaeon]